jgi:hypothetical protein
MWMIHGVTRPTIRPSRRNQKPVRRKSGFSSNSQISAKSGNQKSTSNTLAVQIQSERKKRIMYLGAVSSCNAAFPAEYHERLQSPAPLAYLHKRQSA